MLLNNIVVVLNETWHPGNIGSALRAMKTMGLSRLTLVNPRLWPHPDVVKMAAGAKDLMPSVKVCQTLEDAISSAQLVVATSARSRNFKWPQYSARTCASKIVTVTNQGQNVALIFGQEKTGLHNNQLQLCNLHAIIPANPHYGVLNVASAVQILSYEIWQAYQEASQKNADTHGNNTTTIVYPRQQELVYFYNLLESTLKDINFIIAKHPGEVMTKLKRFFSRARPEQSELNILQGVLSRIKQLNNQINHTKNL